MRNENRSKTEFLHVVIAHCSTQPLLGVRRGRAAWFQNSCTWSCQSVLGQNLDDNPQQLCEQITVRNITKRQIELQKLVLLNSGKTWNQPGKHRCEENKLSNLRWSTWCPSFLKQTWLHCLNLEIETHLLEPKCFKCLCPDWDKWERGISILSCLPFSNALSWKSITKKFRPPPPVEWNYYVQKKMFCFLNRGEKKKENSTIFTIAIVLSIAIVAIMSMINIYIMNTKSNNSTVYFELITQT